MRASGSPGFLPILQIAKYLALGQEETGEGRRGQKPMAVSVCVCLLQWEDRDRKDPGTT